MLTPTNRHPARHRAQLTASDVSVMRGVTPVLNHVDLVVTPASRVAIVGENGRGKTTLLHALAGTLVPDSGMIQRIGTLGLAEQEMDSTDNRTVGQAVRERYRRGEGFASFVAVGQDATGYAWRTVLALARALGALKGGAIEIRFEQEAELDLFLQQAGRTPDRTAAVGPRGEMTYRELAERSAALATLIEGAMQRLGAGAPLDRRIGLLADPDPQVLTGILGILQAGGGFVARFAQLLFHALVGHGQFGLGLLGSGQTFGNLLRAFIQRLGDRRPHEFHREPHQDRENNGLRKQGCIDVHRNAFLCGLR